MSTFSDQLCLSLCYMLTDKLDTGHVDDSLPSAQALTLVTIGLCHSTDATMMKTGFDVASSLNNICLRLRLLDEDDRIGVSQNGQVSEGAWIAWRFRESRRRTGLYIWLLDCYLAVTTQTPPRFLGKPLSLRLPCDAELWDAETYDEWARVRLKQYAGADVTAAGIAREDASRLTIREAVRTVRTKQTIPEPNTAFGTAGIIHSLVLRVWDTRWLDSNGGDAEIGQAERYEESHSPSASTNGSPEDAMPSCPYPATIPEYAKWRNSACDALDVLHWDALGTSARSGGQEGPIFLQLHVARLAILTPVRELLGHIGSFRQAGPALAGSADSHPSLLPVHLYDTPLTLQHCREVLATWAVQDRYKARLAVIHAGAVFWHVRRYSSDSFHQPIAVFLAAATLWAFGKFSSAVVAAAPGVQGSDNNRAENRPSTSTAALPQTYQRRMPSRITIDRPIDDELVQHFIRSGDTTGLLLEGVEDLRAGDGPEQVLREGALLLSSLSQIWTVAANYKQSLDAVLNASR